MNNTDAIKEQYLAKTAALVVAAGKGQRSGLNVPKQFHNLAGKPLILYCLEAFESFSFISEIVLVLPAEFLHVTAVKKDLARFSKLSQIVAGGEERQDSVMNGLEALSPDVEYVAIHDGARPFPPKKATEQAILAAQECGAAILAIPVTDTVKQSDADGFILDTIARRALWLAQTPQVFRKDLIIEAHRETRRRGAALTDDAGAVQLLGRPVRLVEGSRNNIKITVNEDFEIATRYLNK
ncbi:MAG TPA: 2-C-methyl-D-erythritol 4-phosphate cytidylyltransferase [Candidatus Sumerlaeota bacterium]|nr:MAG: 2-C-methyl-D-erythritol 4-phosphate cytidylyltransferase [candidate division BRC1 bacterium ADurb.Bin183]HOE62688.1 2-C-methyl-D-erythritol 4-phosphate cytidylyltransferase [Candidatus Sumerlaeota bacterium]HRR29994.1 2-C-methyl-D-erythritol 4-phosphate cytidylyltransferase [Candidatus Sumerlaeia bacterium]HON49448.1 2-C-methyl-D-erythritol 4-phosphate cytidylyltransferase [Candidatus Sumerlaeota bacterium]HOR64802.1 2-C-methyl-D-erythritol 4-phosphate cytidylyltransferase [Candidatus S